MEQGDSRVEIPYDKMPTSRRGIVFKVFLDVLIILTVLVLSLCFAYNFLGIEPAQRGFFCDDQTIQYPYRPDTISDTQAIGICLLVPLALILLIEGVIVAQSKERLAKGNKSSCLKFCRVAYRSGGMFVVGVAGTLFLTEVLKLYAGRLRPHFLDVCDPDFSKVNCSQGYVMASGSLCRGTDREMLTDARKSFPSGHASVAAYGATYIIVNLNIRFTWKGIRLLLPLMQLIIVCVFSYVGVSRVTDNKHHASDVIAGFFLGFIVALFTLKFISKLRRQQDQSPPPLLPLATPRASMSTICSTQNGREVRRTCSDLELNKL